MSYNELTEILEKTVEESWIKSQDKLIYKDNFDISVILSKEIYLRASDESLNVATFDTFFETYNSDQLINAEILFKGDKITNITYLYKNDVIIPLPIAANLVTKFFKHEYSIGKLFSKNLSLFDDLMANAELKVKDSNQILYYD